MKQVQKLAPLSDQSLQATQRTWPQHLLFSWLVGGAMTLLLTLIEIVFLLLFNLLHVLGSVPKRFFELVMLPVHAPMSLFVPLSELLIMSMATFLLTMPVALMRYLQAVHRAQEACHKLYIPFTMIADSSREVKEHYQVGEYHQEPSMTSILDLIQQQEAHQMILGMPGMGKTMALCVYQYILSQTGFSLAFSRRCIPVSIPMKNYSLFLKQKFPLEQEHTYQNRQPMILLHYLQDCDLPGIRYLRPYLQKLFEQGRLLLLCDGFNEIDPQYRSLVSKEIVYLVQETKNRLVMTCREIEYREQPDLVQLVEEGQAVRVVMYPLSHEQVHEVVELSVQRQDKHWQYTAGQILQVIDRSRFHYHCTNPMLLFTLMGLIGRIGIEHSKQIDTRGRLLREYVRQLIDSERQQAKWSRGAPAEQDIIRFLSEIACAARWANDHRAIQLYTSSLFPVAGSERRAKIDWQEIADALRVWLDEHPAHGPFVLEEKRAVDTAIFSDDLPRLVQFTLSAALIELSPSGVLSFRHELIAEYFVAEYFLRLTNKQHLLKQASLLAVQPEVLENAGRWSEPIAIWAGLLDHPLALAEYFGLLASQDRASVLQDVVALGLVCVGVVWTPVRGVDVQRIVTLPTSLEKALSSAIRNQTTRKALARIFTRCAQEGGHEIYGSLFSLIMVEGIDDFLTLLDHAIVPDLLFEHLQDAADTIAYEAQVKRLIRLLGRFGSVVVERSAQLSIPDPDRSSRLRAAAINILGGTKDAGAVKPLLARLRDMDPFIVERATNALIRLGPNLTLEHAIQELADPALDSGTTRVHRAVLAMLGRFLDEPDVERQVSLLQYQHTLEHIVAVLTSHYPAEVNVQLQARKILVREGRKATGRAARDQRWEKVIESLISYLSSPHDVVGRNVTLALQEIGPAATPYLINVLKHPSEIVRMRVVNILQGTHDLRAIPAMLEMVHDSSSIVQQRVAEALRSYAPASIVGLIGLVSDGPSDAAAERAAQILASIGASVVEPVIDVLPKMIPERTRILVQLLETVHDSRAIPALIAVLQAPQLEPLLAVASICALGQFQDAQVVPALLAVLSSSNTLIYEQAITALSMLGEVAFPSLVAALDSEQEPLVLQRVQRALLGMTPFPGEQLIQTLGESTEVQRERMMAVFVQQGADAALVLVQHLLYPHERLRDTIHRTLEQVPGAIAVPALLGVLGQQELRNVAGAFLLKYPEAAIPALVNLLGEPELGKIAAAILPQFGLVTLRPLVTGLGDHRPIVREIARRMVVSLVRQSSDKDRQAILHEIMYLFHPPLSVRAHEELLGVLTQELADVSLATLLAGLEDARLIESLAEAFMLLARQPEKQTAVLDSLIQSLVLDERRLGAEAALTRIGAAAVLRVGELITDQRRLIAKSAKQILRDIGAPALSLIWTAHSDRSDTARREAAMEIFRSMRTEVIKDELVALLMSDRRDAIAMAVALLLERIHEESKQPYEERVMVAELVDYVQTHTVEGFNLRIIALLLLLGEHTIVDHLIQSLEDYPHSRKQLIYMLLLLGNETQHLLLQVFNDPDTAAEVRFELAAVLGMLSAPQEIRSTAQSMSRYGLTTNRTGVLFPMQLAVALRALGGLLASGYWNAQKLLELRDASKSGDPARELFNILLGWRYEPQIAKLQNDLEVQRDTFKNEVLALTGRIILEQRRAQGLEGELDKLRQEHGSRGDELIQVSRERDAFRAKIDQLTKEKQALQVNIEIVAKEKATLAAQVERIRKEYQDLQQKQANTR